MLFKVSLGFFDGFAIFLQQHAYKLLYSMSVVFCAVYMKYMYVCIYIYMQCIS